MPHLINLQLSPPNNSLRYVCRLPGLDRAAIDESYGLVAISPKRSLYVIRVSGPFDRTAVLALPEVKGIHADVRISAIEPDADGRTKDD